MKKSILSSANIVLFGAALATVLVFSTGCEWESSGSEGSWDDSMSWANFSGLYRSGSNNRSLVSNYSVLSGNIGGAGDASEPYFLSHRVNGQTLGNVNAFSTVISGEVDIAGELTPAALSNLGISSAQIVSTRITPGSFTIAFYGNSTSGSAGDDQNGILSGAWTIVGVSQASPLAGSITYDTGAFSLVFQSPGILEEDVALQASFMIEITVDENFAGGGGGDGGNTDTGIYTLQVDQTGNRLRFVDNDGRVWEGSLSSMVVPGGDRTGRTSGDVVANFEVRGTGAINSYMIQGSFRGLYVRPSTEGESGLAGMLGDRNIQGTWLQPGWQGDLYGVSRDNISVDISATDQHSP